VFGGCYGIEEFKVPLAPSNQNFPTSIRSYTDVYRGDFVTNVKKVELTRDTFVVPSYAFLNMNRLEDLIFPETIQRFDNNALNGMPKVKKLDISMAMEYGTSLIQDCESLEELTIRLESVYDKSRPSYFQYFFATESGFYSENDFASIKKVTVKGNNTTLAVGAFQNATHLEEIILPDTLTMLSEKMLEGCGALTTLTIPLNVREIGKEAFQNCVSLTAIDIPKGVHTIGEYAFESCTLLETVAIPSDSQIYSLGASIFSNCTALTNISFPDNSIWEISGGLFYNCISLTDFHIPFGVQFVRASAFRNSGLKKIAIPKTVMNIDWYAFQNCVDLEEINFAETNQSRLKEIGRGAFENCPMIEEIVLPPSLTDIVGRAFADCVSLSKVVVLREYNWLTPQDNCTALRIGAGEDGQSDNVFDNCSPYLKIYVPKNNAGIMEDDPETGAKNGVTAYKEYGPGWGDYQHIIFAIPKEVYDTLE